MNNRKIYLWVGASHPHNSIFIQAQLVSHMLADQFKVVIEILHPEVIDIRSKLSQISESGNIIIWHYGGFDQYLVSLKNKTNIVFVYHNITPACFFWKTQPLVALRSIVGRIQLAVLRKSLKWITMSAYNSRELREFGFNNILVCPNIITVNKQKNKVKTKCISLLYVGRISPNKNCISLLREAEKVANYFKESVEFTIVGSVKPGCRHGKKFIEKYKELLDHPWLKVVWERNLDVQELHSLYEQSWLYITMSLHEGFGVPSCESIAHGTPALYIECGGQESVLNSKGMVPLNDINKYSEYVIEYLVNQNDRNKLQNDQYDIVKNYMSPYVDQKVYTTYHKIIEGLL